MVDTKEGKCAAMRGIGIFSNLRRNILSQLVGVVKNLYGLFSFQIVGWKFAFLCVFGIE